MTKYRTQTKYISYTIKECIDWTSLTPRLSQKPGYEAMTTAACLLAQPYFAGVVLHCGNLNH